MGKGLKKSMFFLILNKKKENMFKWIVLLTLLCLSCSDDLPLMMEEAENEFIHIGEYKLLEESIEQMPYQNFDQVIFVDSLGVELNFSIVNNSIFTSDSSILYRYNVNEIGDTVMYMYSSEVKVITLENEEQNLYFRSTLRAQPFYSDPESGKVADVYEIYCRQADVINSSSQVFIELINQRTWPNEIQIINIQEVTILGRIFANVRMNDFIEPKSEVMINDNFGIVSFTDHEGHLWRFERFE